MDHLHIRVPAALKEKFKERCKNYNVALTSAIIMLMKKELQSDDLTENGDAEEAAEYYRFFTFDS